MASWREVVAFSQPLTNPVPDDKSISLRVMMNLPVIVWDKDDKQRRVVPMRWGFPTRSNPNRPDIIHARSETIDEKPSFAEAFADGQRGIVIVKTFNEGLELANGKTEQHTIALGDTEAVGIAFLWRRFDIGLPMPLIACVMATVAANTIISKITDRMPAILAPGDWGKWLGDEPASPEAVKACLKTVDDVRWTMSPEMRARQPRAKPNVSRPTGLF